MALKAELQAGKMKTVKPFSKTCYSENLVLDSSPVADKEREDGSLIDGGDKAGEGDAPAFHGGLGLRFKFPGDPKKYVAPPTPGHHTYTVRGFERRPRRNYGQTILRVRLGTRIASIHVTLTRFRSWSPPYPHPLSSGDAFCSSRSSESLAWGDVGDPFWLHLPPLRKSWAL
jgi:hypothetical protein